MLENPRCIVSFLFKIKKKYQQICEWTLMALWITFEWGLCGNGGSRFGVSDMLLDIFPNSGAVWYGISHHLQDVCQWEKRALSECECVYVCVSDMSVCLSVHTVPNQVCMYTEGKGVLHALLFVAWILYMSSDLHIVPFSSHISFTTFVLIIIGP